MALNGLDIASYQEGIDLSAVPCDFVIVKATEGVTYVNPDYDRAFNQAKSVGKLTGVYHYMAMDDAAAEADHFLDVAQGAIGNSVLVLDWEGDAVAQGPGRAWDFISHVHDRTGVWPMVYMSKTVTNEYDWSQVAGNCGLWMAQYPDYNPGGYQDQPWTDGNGVGAWSGWAMQQYTSVGQLDGWDGNLDLDIFYGDGGTWNAYAASNGASTPAPAPAPSGQGSPVDFNAIADAVINGDYGNGDDRKAALGANYDAVQAIVNARLSTPAPTPEPAPVDLNALADAVIRGDYGDGDDRRSALGNNYDAVQEIVNQRMGVSDAPQAQTYTVQDGDTLSGIAAQFGTDYQTIAAANGIDDPDIIYPGQVLTI